MTRSDKWQSPAQVSKDHAHDILIQAGNNFRGVILMDVIKDPALVELAKEIGVWDELMESDWIWPDPEGKNPA